MATNIALPLLLTVTSVGLDATLANEPLSDITSAGSRRMRYVGQ